MAASHIKHYTGKFQVSRGDPVGQGQTGEAWSRKICEEWDSPGKRRRWQLSTDKNGVGVWPNTFTWTWDESSQVKSSVMVIFYKLLPYSQRHLVVGLVGLGLLFTVMARVQLALNKYRCE